MDKVGVPTVSGLKNSMISYALGLGGGLLYSLSVAIFGSGLIGGLLGAGIAGATIKGTRGEIIATVLGFQSVIGASTSSSTSADTLNSRGII